MGARQSFNDWGRASAAALESRTTGIDCIFLTCLDDDFDLFKGLLRVSGIRMHRANTVEEADFLLTVTEATVLITDTLFLDGTWNIAAGMISSFHPSVSLLITAEECDRDSVAGRPAGAIHDLVARPMRLTQLRQAIQSAHRATEGRRLFKS